MESAEDDVKRDWYAPIVADAEAGFGGVLNAYELMKVRALCSVSLHHIGLIVMMCCCFFADSAANRHALRMSCGYGTQRHAC